MTTERVFIVVGAIVAVVLQLLVAPYIALFGAVPNIVAAYAVALAVVRPSSYGCLLPFVLGLAFDFMSMTPVGAMAFSLMVVSVLTARVFSLVDNDSLFTVFAFMALGVLLVEVVYAALVLAGGYAASLADALIYRVVPCFLYDFVLSLVLYPLVTHFAKPSGATRTELTILR